MSYDTQLSTIEAAESEREREREREQPGAFFREFSLRCKYFFHIIKRPLYKMTDVFNA